MKIALASYEYPPETGFGGIGTYTWYQARALSTLGHDVHVIAGSRRAGDHGIQDRDGVRVHRFRVGRPWQWLIKPLGMAKLWWVRNRMDNAFSMFQALTALADEYRYDVVELPDSGAEGFLVNGHLDCPTVVRLHSPARLIGGLYGLSKAEIRLCAALEESAARRATALSACCRYLQTEAANTLGMDRPVRVIANGIDPTLFDIPAPREPLLEAGLRPERLRIVFAGRLETRKGIEACVDIAARIVRKYNVDFVFAGVDADRHFDQLAREVAQDGKQRGALFHLGHLEMAGIRALMQSAGAVLIPSAWDACPYTCLEAMAAGRAVVASNQGGLPELIRHDVDGLLVETGNVRSYVRALERLIEQPSLRERLGRSARARIERDFNAARVADVSVNFYKEIASRYT